MKTAEEWDAKSQLTINKGCKEYRLAIYRECQLDAFKAGERFAAERVIEMTRIPDDAIKRGTGVRDWKVIEGEKMAVAILTDANNRTELP